MAGMLLSPRDIWQYLEMTLFTTAEKGVLMASGDGLARERWLETFGPLSSCSPVGVFLTIAGGETVHIHVAFTETAFTGQ